MDRFRLRTNDSGAAVILCTPSFAAVVANLARYAPEDADEVTKMASTQSSILGLTKLFADQQFRAQLPQQWTIFQDLVQVWNDVVQLVRKWPVPRAFVQNDEARVALAAAIECCGDLKRGLAKELQEMRDICPSLYLLSDQGLNNLLATSWNAGAALPGLGIHVNIHSLVLEEGPDCNFVTGVRGRDGAIFFLDEQVPVNEKSAHTLQNLILQMKATLQQNLTQAVKASRMLRESVFGRSQAWNLSLASHLLLHHPSQIAEVLLRLRFAKAVEEALNDNLPLYELLQNEETVLKGFADICSATFENMRPISSPTPGVIDSPKKSKREQERERRCAERLMGAQMEHIQTIKSLIREGVETVQAKAWRRQMRFYWSDVRQSVLINLNGIDMEYGYWYHDWADGQPYFQADAETCSQVFQSIRNPIMVSMVGGAAGGVATSTAVVQELAKRVGKPSWVWRLDPGAEGLNSQVMNVLAGAFTTGTWVVFEGLESCPTSTRATVRKVLERYSRSITDPKGHEPRLKMDILDPLLANFTGTPATSARSKILTVTPTVLVASTTTQTDVLPAEADVVPDAQMIERSPPGTPVKAIPMGLTIAAPMTSILASRGPSPSSTISTHLATLGFSVAASRMAGERVQELTGVIAGLKGTEKTLALTADLYRRVCSIASYVYHTLSRHMVPEPSAIALAIHASLLPAVGWDEGHVILRTIHEMFPDVDFLWLYSVFLQTSKNAILSELERKGLRQSKLPEVWHPEGGHSKGPASGLEGGPRKHPSAPRDGYVIRQQAILLSMEASVALFSKGASGKENDILALTRQGSTSSNTLAITPHLCVTGIDGAGKSTAFHILRAALADAFITSEANTEKNLARLSIHPGMTPDELLGFVDPISTDWRDGVLMGLVREGLQFISKGKGGKPQHFWILVDGVPSQELMGVFGSVLSRSGELELRSGEIIKLTPYLHFVFEVPWHSLATAPPLLFASCLVLQVEDDSLRGKPIPAPKGRPKYLEFDISGALVTDHEIRREFEKYDLNGNGWIDKAEFHRIYTHEYDHYGMEGDVQAKMDTLLDEYNMLGDGKLSYDEFALLMLKLAQR